MAKASSRDVFIIHGRDHEKHEFFKSFLRCVGLNPLEFTTLISRTGSASPYIADVVATALNDASAIIVLFTGDEEAQLRPEYGIEEKGRQPRPNVILEAGMALATDRARTVIVEIGELRGMTDLHGIHTVRFSSGRPEERHALVERLRSAGCAVDTTGTDWHTLRYPSSPSNP